MGLPFTRKENYVPGDKGKIFKEEYNRLTDELKALSLYSVSDIPEDILWSSLVKLCKNNTFVDTGVVNALVLNNNNTGTLLIENSILSFIANTTNTGATSVSVGDGGILPIYFHGAALSEALLKKGRLYYLELNSNGNNYDLLIPNIPTLDAPLTIPSFNISGSSILGSTSNGIIIANPDNTNAILAETKRYIKISIPNANLDTRLMMDVLIADAELGFIPLTIALNSNGNGKQTVISDYKKSISVNVNPLIVNSKREIYISFDDETLFVNPSINITKVIISTSTINIWNVGWTVLMSDTDSNSDLTANNKQIATNTSGLSGFSTDVIKNQLALTTVNPDFPTLPEMVSDFNGPTNQADVVVSKDAIFVIQRDGGLMVAGKSERGSLGLGPNKLIANELTKIDIPPVAKIFTGTDITFALLKDGTLLVCGYYSPRMSATDFGNILYYFSPVINGDDVKEVVCCKTCSFLLKNSGALWFTGVGLDIISNLGLAGKFNNTNIGNIKNIYGDDTCLITVDNNNDMKVAGKNTSGRLSKPLDVIDLTELTSVFPVGSDIKEISISPTFMIALTNDGVVWSVGDTMYNDESWEEYSFTSNEITDVKSISSGDAHVLAVKNDGTLWGYGDNLHGQGDNHNVSIDIVGLDQDYAPLARYPFEETKVSNVKKAIAFGKSTIVIKNDSEVIGIGENKIRVLDIGNEPIPNVKQINFNSNNTLMLKEDGSFWVAGYNGTGSLGLGNYYSQSNFFRKSPLEDVNRIFTDTRKSFIIKNDGTLWACGLNDLGHLGLNTTDNVNTFQEVPQNFVDIKDIVVKSSNTFILLSDGSVWATGNNNYGQFGLNDTTNRYVFTLLPVTDVVEIATDGFTTFLLDADGYCWVAGKYAVEGDGGSIIFNKMITSGSIKTISYHSNGLLVIKTDDTLWAYGMNTSGHLGIGETILSMELTNTGVTNVKELHRSDDISAVTKNDGSYWITGNNEYGQLGMGDEVSLDVFTAMSINNERKLILSATTTYILKENGEVWRTGSENNDDGLASDRTSSFVQEDINRIKDLEVSERLTIFKNYDNHFFIKGFTDGLVGIIDSFSRLGTGFESYEFDPVQIPITSSVDVVKSVSEIKTIPVRKNFTRLAANPLRSFLVKEYNKPLLASGIQSDGELGVGTIDNIDQYTTAGIPDIKDIFVKNRTTFLTTHDGKLYAAGKNSSDELSLGSTDDLLTFTLIPGITDVKNIMQITGALIVIKNNGSVWVNGYNAFNRLGLGHSNDITEFVEFSDGFDIKQINFNDSGCMIKTNDELWVWGYNYYQELGVDVGLTVPLMFSGVRNVKKILAAGNQTIVILKNDGTVWGCGRNAQSELGLGDSEERHEFTLLPITDVKTFTITTYYTMVLKNDGTVWVTGSNTSWKTRGRSDLPDNLSVFTDLNVENINTVYPGYANTFLRSKDNRLWGIGSNSGTLIRSNYSNSYIFDEYIEIDIPGMHELYLESHYLFNIDKNGVLTHKGNAWRLSSLGLSLTQDVKELTNLHPDLNIPIDAELYQYRTIFTENQEEFFQTAIKIDPNVNEGSRYIRYKNSIDGLTQWFNSTSVEIDMSFLTSFYDGVPAIMNTLGKQEDFIDILEEDIGNVGDITSDLALINGDVINRFNAGAGGPRTAVRKITADNEFASKDSVIVPTLDGVDFETFLQRHEIEISALYLEEEFSNSSGRHYVHAHGNSFPSPIPASYWYLTYFYSIDRTDSSNVKLRVTFTIVEDTADTNKRPEMYIASKLGIDIIDPTLTPQLTDVLTVNDWVRIDNERLDWKRNVGKTTFVEGDVYRPPESLNIYKLINFKDELVWMKEGKIKIIPIKESFTGNDGSIIITEDRKMLATGRNYNGRFGLGDNVDRDIYTEIPINDINYFKASSHSTYVLKNDGTVWVCGDNTYGQLGLGNNTHQYTFVQLVDAVNVKAISVGWKHLLVLKADGTLWATGSNLSGQLGLGDEVDRNTLTDTGMVDIDKIYSMNSDFNLIIKTDGTVLTVGHNGYGQLGLGDEVSRNIYEDTSIIGAVDFFVGPHSFAFTKSDNTLWVAGRNAKGELGLGDNINRNLPTQTVIENGIVVDKIIFGYESMFMLTNKGNLWSTGSNPSFILLFNDEISRNTLCNTGIKNIKNLSAGLKNTTVIYEDGVLKNIGTNNGGQLGLGNIQDVDKLTFVELAPTAIVEL